MKNITVLVTGVGGPGGPGIIKSLRLAGERKVRIIGVDMEKESIGSALVDKFYVIPPAGEKNFINEILRISIKEKVNVILPLVTNELMPLSKNKDMFEKMGIKVSVSDINGLIIANNKYLLLQSCKDNNMPTPEFYLVKNIDDLVDKAKKIGYPQKMVCVKPPVSMGMRGFRILDSKLDRVKLLLKEKPTSIFATIEDIIAVLKTAVDFPELLVTEYLPGEEYSVDALSDQGKPLVVIPRIRIKIKMGVSFCGILVNDGEIIKYSEKIIKTLNLNGNIGFQFKKDEKGMAKIIESNPRLQGSIVLNTAGGANLVYLAVKIALGEKIKQPKVKWQTKMVRYWDEMYYTKAGRPFSI